MQRGGRIASVLAGCPDEQEFPGLELDRGKSPEIEFVGIVGQVPAIQVHGGIAAVVNLDPVGGIAVIVQTGLSVAREELGDLNRSMCG